ncbi:PSP1 C-terminal domain protein [Bacteriovorax sp. BSW11_IV]|uniref:PSP1 domain-containing protein n=1 Tax=Bacteriovorax sp. BSW11_IV TaxID=1353529 RepID=UPI00038A386A|nr:regulatory iron-sulfur-containing complex subunit RicT [Bacteriovorax sp. BSW11_IV]EQC48470.1 PSP1 C-terminal domain protein [Bacteriovorax sp. BSW11_IV]
MQDNTENNENTSSQEVLEDTQPEQNDTNEDSANESNESRFKEGDSVRLIRVRFPGNAKSHPFLVGKRAFLYGQKVLAMSDRGMTVGYINSLPYETQFTKDLMPLRSIAKLASEEDIEEQKSYAKKERDAEKICLRLIDKYALEMNLTHVEFIQFGKKAVFYFTAPARVDFRELVKELVSDLKMRIELRQISVRDRAAALGAVGACGLQTCCSSFLTNYGNVSIKMAKNQNLALIPSKINGVCGQIKCCIRYEDDVYSEKREHLPREGSYIKVQNGDIGKVLKLHILIEQFDMLTDGGQIRRYARGQYDDKNCEPSLSWVFPDSFQHIVNETSTVIGITDEEALRLEKYRQEVDEDDDSYDDSYDESDESYDDEDEDTSSSIDDEDEAEIIASSKFRKEGYSDDDADVIEPEIAEAPKHDNRNNRNNNNQRPRNQQRNFQAKRDQGGRDNNNRDNRNNNRNRNRPDGRPQENRSQDGQNSGAPRKNFKRPHREGEERNQQQRRHNNPNQGQGQNPNHAQNSGQGAQDAGGQNRNRPNRNNRNRPYKKNRNDGNKGGSGSPNKPQE